MSSYIDESLRDGFIEWLKGFNAQNLKGWNDLYNNDPEAAMCEAAFWKVLVANDVDVAPNADLSGATRAPDFLCRKNGQKFYVEVTCISIATAAGKTKLPHCGHFEGKSASLNSAIFEAIRKKTEQCGELDAPSLVGVGTFHFLASLGRVDKQEMGLLLLGVDRPMLSVGQEPGDVYCVTHLAYAPFLRPDKKGISPARAPVSGVLIGGFGCRTPRVYGLLHQEAARPFDRQLLPQIEFCRLQDYASGRLCAEWI